MNKAVFFAPIILILLLTNCQQDPIVSNHSNELGMSYEEIMNENQAWQISKVESEEPRTFVFSYIKTDEEGFPTGLDTVSITSNNWLSQFEQASTYDPGNFPTGVLVKLDFDYSTALTSSMYVEYKLPDMEAFETTSIGSSRTVDDLTTFNIDLSTLHKYFYGYHIQDMTIDQGDDKETWINFQASKQKISFQVEKTYLDTAYAVSVELIPAD